MNTCMENTINKSKELKASINLLNDKLHFEGLVDSNQPVSIDYVPPFGDNLGYTSLELLLLSLSSCLGSAVLLFLRRMNKEIKGFSIDSHGIRKDEHPTCFKTITMVVNLKSSNCTQDDLSKVIKMAEETYCPVWAMIKGNVEVIVRTNIAAG